MFFHKFKAPWEKSLPSRIRHLVTSQKQKVAYFYEKPDSSTFRYRVYNMCQSLEESQQWTGVYFFEHEIPEVSLYLNEISVLILCRTRWSLPFDQLIEKANQKNIPVLFDIDDLVFNLDKVPLVMNTLNTPFKEETTAHWFSYVSRLWQLGKKCKATIGTNDYISHHLKMTFNTPSYSLCNFLNQEQIQASMPLFQQPSKNRTFTLGYFSGSPSHANDFAKIAPEIAEILSEFPEIHLEVGGFMEFPSFMKSFIKNKRITHSSFVDFITLQTKISKVDINLVPLIDNEFTQCKSELKFFEAAIVGTVTLASPTHVYKENIEHAKTGYLCEEGDWYETIKSLYQNKVSPELLSNANYYCLNKYAPSTQLLVIEKLLNHYV